MLREERFGKKSSMSNARIAVNVPKQPAEDTQYARKCCGYTLQIKSRPLSKKAHKQGIPVKVFACLLCK